MKQDRKNSDIGASVEKQPRLNQILLVSSYQTKEYPWHILEENERLESWGMKTLDGQHEGSVSGTEVYYMVS